MLRAARLTTLAHMVAILIVVLVLQACGGGGTEVGAVEGYVYVPQSRAGRQSHVISRAAGPPTGYVALAGAQVTVTAGGTSVTGQTDANGHFSISGIPAGTANVHVVDPTGAHAPFDASVEVKGNATASVGSNGQVSLVSQSATSLAVTVDQVKVDAWPQVTAYVSVTDPAQLTPVLGLTKQNFTELVVNGVPVQQFSVAQTPDPQAQPTSVALVEDCSGSMEGQAFDDAKAALLSFAGNLSQSDRAELIRFDSRNTIAVVQGFTNDATLLTQAVRSLQTGDSTALYDAIWKGVDEVAAQPEARRAVVVMTDGGENDSTVEHGGAGMDSLGIYHDQNNGALIAHAKALHVPVYAIGLQGSGFSREAKIPGKTRPATSREAEIDLQAIATQTGGGYYLAPTSADLVSVYTRVTARRQQEYLLTYADLGTGPRAMTLKVSAFGLLGQSTATQYAGPTDSSRTSTGFFWPTGRPITPNSNGDLDQNWLYGGPGKPEYYPDLYHNGADISAKLEDLVVAVASGKVVKVNPAPGEVRDAGWGMGNYAVFIQHYASNSTLSGSPFLALYGHIRSSGPQKPVHSLVKEGDTVTAGQVIGVVGHWDGGDHLHFGIVPGTTPPSTSPSGTPVKDILGWGRMGLNHWPDPNHFVQPVSFITSHSPK